MKSRDFGFSIRTLQTVTVPSHFSTFYGWMDFSSQIIELQSGNNQDLSNLNNNYRYLGLCRHVDIGDIDDM